MYRVAPAGEKASEHCPLSSTGLVRGRKTAMTIRRQAVFFAASNPSVTQPFFISSLMPSSKPVKSFLMWYDVTDKLSPRLVTVI